MMIRHMMLQDILIAEATGLGSKHVEILILCHLAKSHFADIVTLVTQNVRASNVTNNRRFELSWVKGLVLSVVTPTYPNLILAAVQ
jgi:hypothetical protein